VKQQSRKDRIRTALLWTIFGLSIGLFIGVAITLRVGAVPQTLDVVSVLEATLTFVVTTLAILGAFVVIVTWNGIESRVRDGVVEYGEKAAEATKSLDDKIDKINKNLDERMEIINGKIEVSVNEMDQQLHQQKREFRDEMSKNLKEFKLQTSKLDNQLQKVEQTTIILATASDPWRVETLANDLLLIDPLSAIAFHMVISYLKEFDKFFPELRSKKSGGTLFFAPEEYSSLYCWDKALEWHGKVKRQKLPPRIESAEREVDRRRPFAEEEYKKQQVKLISE
jgi:hypothetical protein